MSAEPSTVECPRAVSHLRSFFTDEDPKTYASRNTLIFSNYFTSFFFFLALKCIINCYKFDRRASARSVSVSTGGLAMHLLRAMNGWARGK